MASSRWFRDEGAVGDQVLALHVPQGNVGDRHVLVGVRRRLGLGGEMLGGGDDVLGPHALDDLERQAETSWGSPPRERWYLAMMGSAKPRGRYPPPAPGSSWRPPPSAAAAKETEAVGQAGVTGLAQGRQ